MSEHAEATVREIDPWACHSLDMAACSTLEIVVPLHEEFEKAGLRPESWPASVRNWIEREAMAWIAAHPERAVRSVTTGLGLNSQRRPSCVMVLHHAPKNGACKTCG